jgi:signal peptidase I
MSNTTENCIPGPAFGLRLGAQSLGCSQRLGLALLAAALVALLIQRFLFCLVVVCGESMAPDLREGQVCLVGKALQGITRGDVVIARDGEGQTVKRVVGLPNESLYFSNGKVYVNGRELPEPYLPQATRTYPLYQTRFTLGPEHFFLMGDNRARSQDSRSYGPLHGKSILGKVAR